MGVPWIFYYEQDDIDFCKKKWRFVQNWACLYHCSSLSVLYNSICCYYSDCDIGINKASTGFKMTVPWIFYNQADNIGFL